VACVFCVTGVVGVFTLPTRVTQPSFFPDVETFKPRKFVAYGVKDLSAPQEASADEAGCNNQFHATGGWGKVLNTSSKKQLDEAGLMGMTCFHGIPLRYLNIHGTGERQVHGVALLKDILDYDPELKVRLCYDVSCVFVPALARLLPDDAHKVKGAIGRFHIYAHRYACHVLWSTLRLKGFGLMVGEEIEQHWSRIAHLIPSGRVSSGPRKMQKLDACSVSLSWRALETFGGNLHSRWKKARQVEEEESVKLQQILRETVPERTDKGGRVHPRQRVTIEYLDQQALDQIEYFTKYQYVPSTSVYKSVHACTRLYTLVHNLQFPQLIISIGNLKPNLEMLSTRLWLRRFNLPSNWPTLGLQHSVAAAEAEAAVEGSNVPSS
jgi:hypothetical protein